MWDGHSQKWREDFLIKQSVVGFGLKKSNQSMSMDSCMGLNELLKITSMGRGRMPVD